MNDEPVTKSICECDDWALNEAAITGVCVVSQVHGFPYSGKKFTHCPWCGGVLKMVTIPDKPLIKFSHQQ